MDATGGEPAVREQSMSYRWWSSCVSDKGQRRKINEDAYLALPERGVWLIADGMGGHARGDRASRCIVDAFADFPECENIAALILHSRERLRQANDTIFQESAALPDAQIMGSTVVVFLALRHEYACLWAGDSRIYLQRGGALEQLTKDHSVVQQLIDRGEVSAAEAKSHPAANRITRAVGSKPNLVVDEVRGTLSDGDLVLLCSDGLTLEVDDGEIATVLDELDCDSATQELLDLALERGARDNVTLGIVHFEETTGINQDSADSTAINYALRKRATTLSGVALG